MFAKGARIAPLPPLAGLDDRPPVEAAAASAKYIEDLQGVCGATSGWAATSLVLELTGTLTHCAVLIGRSGLELVQPQLHRSERTAWPALGDRVETADLPFGRVAMTTSDDSIYPEMYRLLPLAGAEIAITPVAPLEKWELKTGRVERAAENRINLLAPCKTVPLGEGLAACLQTISPF
jgi:predicted amidohydrolase